MEHPLPLGERVRDRIKSAGWLAITRSSPPSHGPSERMAETWWAAVARRLASGCRRLLMVVRRMRRSGSTAIPIDFRHRGSD
jgi:hypothetical protein